MAKPETIARFNEIFREIFDNPKIEIFDAMTASDVPGWDSLNHINLVVSVEAAFKVKFTIKEIMAFKNVGEFLAAVESKSETTGAR